MEIKRWNTEKPAGKLFALLFGAALLVVPATSAQYGAPKPQQPAQQPPAAGQAKPGETPAPAAPPVNKEEEDAAKAYLAMSSQNPAVAIPAGEDFLQKYPTSQFRDGVYTKLLHDYLNDGKEDKVVATGDKALKENPDNVDVLAFMSWYLGHRHHPQALDAEQRLLSVNQYAHHALLLIAALQKPDYVTEESFARAKSEKEGLSHSGLGLFYFWTGKTQEEVDELSQSTALDPTPDPTDFYLLGDGESKLKKYSEASSAYERCSLVAWAWQDKCKTKLAQAQALAAAQPPAPTAPAATPALAPAPATDPAKPKPPIS